MVRATWLQPQTRYSDTEAGASRIILQASMHLRSPQHAPETRTGSAWSGMPKVMLCCVINKQAGTASVAGV